MKITPKATCIIFAWIIFVSAGIHQAYAINIFADARVENKHKSHVTGLYTYWIISRNMDGTYTLSDDDTGQCEDEASDPCKISTDTDYSLHGMKVSQQDVDQENGIEILSYRNLN